MTNGVAKVYYNVSLNDLPTYTGFVEDMATYNFTYTVSSQAIFNLTGRQLSMALGLKTEHTNHAQPTFDPPLET